MLLQHWTYDRVRQRVTMKYKEIDEAQGLKSYNDSTENGYAQAFIMSNGVLLLICIIVVWLVGVRFVPSIVNSGVTGSSPKLS